MCSTRVLAPYHPTDWPFLKLRVVPCDHEACSSIGGYGLPGNVMASILPFIKAKPGHF
jgi:hypothetical protein